MLAAVTGTLVLATACGDGGGVEPDPNTAPVANFAPPSCTINVPCNFVDASTDDAAVTAWTWSFGDGTPVVTTEDAAHTYGAAGSFNVVLTVADAEGLTNSKTVAVTVSPATPTNTPPVAAFTSPACTVNVPCLFTDASTDNVAVTAWAWNFGDGTPVVTTEDASHTYATAGTFQVNLTVTDGEGLTGTVTQPVTVNPSTPGIQDCTTTGKIVACNLAIAARATVRITLTAVSCELGAQRVFIPAPIGPKQVFGNVCARSAGQVYTLTDAAGAPRVLEAGTVLPIRFEQGIPEEGDPAVVSPAGTQEGTFGSGWTLRFDDGGNPIGQPGFDENVVLTVIATPQ